MIGQINQWIDYAAAGLDLVLLLRVIGLRLQKTYVFITLACVLNCFFDILPMLLVRESPEWRRVLMYADLVFTVVFPLAAWDVFEEVAKEVAVLKRLAAMRMITSLFIVSVFGFVLAGLSKPDTDDAGLGFIGPLALITWIGGVTASLAFIWTVHRGLRAQKIVTPNNTLIWTAFFELFLMGQIAGSFLFLLLNSLGVQPKATGPQIVEGVFTLYNIGIMIWCILKLRALPKDAPSALNENS